MKFEIQERSGDISNIIQYVNPKIIYKLQMENIPLNEQKHTPLGKCENIIQREVEQ